MARRRSKESVADDRALADWAQDLCSRNSRLQQPRIEAAVQRLAERNAPAHLETGLELAQLASAMELDTESVLAALFYRPARHGGWGKAALDPVIGAEAAGLVLAVKQMADSRILDLTSARLLASEAKDQTVNIRRMLVALIDDGRVAVLKLAERVVAMRRARQSSEERKARIATEALTVFVPLADRLGIWQLKWELEDLALLYLEPGAYARIAEQLAGRRRQREAQVRILVAQLKRAFAARDMQAEVAGRAKHIYSIWRKMSAKGIPFNEVHDVQALRVIVETAPECYAALGIVHACWPPVPHELDDYVASPKENGYQSLHTAVVGDDGAVFEVQIRTREMHRAAELGVCAHWAYKGMDAEDDHYASKVASLRRVLDAEARGETSLAQGLAGELEREAARYGPAVRVFVYTPRGQVLDLADGATPLDFAYRVHTEVGHKCIGAEVDGRLLALNARLESGQRVRILTGSAPAPRALWLDPDLGYANTARAREKIREWLRSQSPQTIEAAGRADWQTVVAGFAHSRLDPADLPGLVSDPILATESTLFQALGTGEAFPLQVLQPRLASFDGGSDAFRLRILATDRENLLRDLVAVVSRFGLSMSAAGADVDSSANLARLELKLMLADLYELGRVMQHLRQVREVQSVNRIPEP